MKKTMCKRCGRLFDEEGNQLPPPAVLMGEELIKRKVGSIICRSCRETDRIIAAMNREDAE